MALTSQDSAPRNQTDLQARDLKMGIRVDWLVVCALLTSILSQEESEHSLECHHLKAERELRDT